MVFHMAPKERKRETLAISQTLRAERAARALTQKGLAEAAGIPEQTYIRYETGAREIPALQLMRVAEALDISFSTFARRIQERLDETA